ncbi:MAG: DUF4298 domain-containing protein [Lachnospiraceae bacterium]|nr:DUF4298 domain-containing protein [Lachnospiraceae bacterium]
MNQVERIHYYEQLLTEATAVLAQYEEALDTYLNAQEKIALLEKYYTSKAWRKDFEAFERNELPEGLLCGVLSEDGIDHLLEENKELLRRSCELSAEE